jgi:hypothetical protein
MRHGKFALLVLLLAFLVACTATLQEQWNALTPKDQAMVVINQAQDQLTDNFRIGKDYVAAKPEYQAVWKAEIVPAFDLANKAVKSALNLATTGTITPDIVYKEVMPLVKVVLTKLVAIGAIKK